MSRDVGNGALDERTMNSSNACLPLVDKVVICSDILLGNLLDVQMCHIRSCRLLGFVPNTAWCQGFELRKEFYRARVITLIFHQDFDYQAIQRRSASNNILGFVQTIIIQNFR